MADNSLFRDTLRIAFDFGAMQKYDLDSTDVDTAIKEAGLDEDTCTLSDAASACRAYAAKHRLGPFALPMLPGSF